MSLETSHAIPLALDTTLIAGTAIVGLKTFRDDRGALGVLEFADALPFVPSRAFYIRPSDPPRPRAGHASSAYEAFFALTGHVVLDLDNGREKQSIRLENADIGVVTSPGLWLKLYGFAANAIILVFAEGQHAKTRYFPDPQPTLINRSQP